MQSLLARLNDIYILKSVRTCRQGSSATMRAEEEGSLYSGADRSQTAPGCCPLRRVPLALVFSSVLNLRVRLVRIAPFTVAVGRAVCLFMDFNAGSQS